MNKTEINRLLPDAYRVLNETGIAEEGKIVKTYRGYIATFGAAVSGGSLLAAIAFFSDKGEANQDRTKLMEALYRLVKSKKESPQAEKGFFEYILRQLSNGNGIVAEREAEWKEKCLNAAIALKLAMNLYKLEKEEK